MIKLHKYQSEAIDAISTAWTSGNDSPAVILPTGTGKTVVFSTLARQLRRQGTRVVILVHREELVLQTVAMLGVVSPDFDLGVGIVKADANDVEAPVIVASCQTLYRSNRIDSLVASLAGQDTVVIFDEVHHASSLSNRRVLTQLGCFGGGTRAVGFTATFVRSDAKKLANDWTPVYEKTMAWAIEHGYLTDLTAISVRVPDLDLDKVRTNDGDFGDASLGDAVASSSADTIIPKAWKEHANGRPTILFAPTIASCDVLVDGLKAAGIKTEAVYGSTPTEERQAIYSRVRDGVTQVLASVGVLTEGFDMPAISCAILARPTQSRGLFQQMVGRIVRTFPGKDDAVLLDIVGTTDGHNLANVTDLKKTHTGEVDETLESAPSLCEHGELGVCCSVSFLRSDCIRNRKLGTCYCGCECGESDGRGEIRLVKGAKDVHVDLFTGSSSVWLKTRGGVWFIPTREALFMVLPVADGLYRAARTHDARSAKGSRQGWLSVATDITTAMGIAAELATNVDKSVATRTSSWRRAKASDAQVDLAKKLGLDVDGMRRGPVSDAISVFFASKTIDTALAAKRGGR